MCYKKILPLALFTILAFAGCKKESSDNNDNGPQSTWAFDGVDYAEGSMPTSCSSSGIFSSSDDNKNSSITIEFGSRPTTDGSYTTTALSDTSTLHGNRCSIDLSIPSRNYKSTGSSSGGTVFVSIAGNGKITATFNTIEMQDVVNTSIKKSLSGTLIEK
jgi:hypothetical protein